MKHFSSALILAAAESTAHAGFAFTSQSRSITAQASAQLGAIVDVHSLTATDFGPFNQSVDALAVDPNSGVNGWGRGYQSSSLNSIHISASGGWAGGRTGQGCGGGGTSLFFVVFTLDVAADYTFVGDFDPSLNVFSGPDGFSIDTPGTYTGTLQPGEYSLNLYSSGSASSPPSGGRFSADLTIVPAPVSAAALAALAAAVGIQRRRRD